MLSSSDEVQDVSISWSYTLLSVTDNFGVGKWAKLKETTVNYCTSWKTSPIDWRVYTRNHWVSKTIRQNRMGLSYVFFRSCQVLLPAPPFFSNVSPCSNKRRKLKGKFIFNSCLNLLEQVELLQHVNMKYKNKVYCYVKSFPLTVYWQVFVFYMSTQPFSTTCNHHYKVISQGIGKFVAYTRCLKCHVHNRLKELRRM